MVDVGDPPEDSSIRVQAGVDDTTLSWRAPVDRKSVRRLRTAAGGAFAAAGAVLLWSAWGGVADLMTGNASLAIMDALLLAASLLLVVMALVGYRRIADPAPEVLVLSPGELRHVEPRLPIGRQTDTDRESRSLWLWTAMLLRFPRRRKTTLSREEIEEIRLSGGESGCRVLTVRSGSPSAVA